MLNHMSGFSIALIRFIIAGNSVFLKNTYTIDFKDFWKIGDIFVD